MPTLAFDQAYAEDCDLEDGSTAHLRLIRPEDKALMLQAWSRLSPESRYRRFFSPKAALTADELRYLTELDNVHHLAIGASWHREGEEMAIGVARFIRLTDRPAVADAAITVVDDAQHRGLGRILLTRLIAAAREREIERFTCDLLATNEAMRHLLFSIAPDAVERGDGTTVTIEMPLGDLPELPDQDDRKGALYRILALIGRGLNAARPSFFDPPSER